MSFLSGLQLLFIGLKLTHVIAWPWLVVLVPTIGWAVFTLVCLIIVAALEILG